MFGGGWKGVFGKRRIGLLVPKLGKVRSPEVSLLAVSAGLAFLRGGFRLDLTNYWVDGLKLLLRPHNGIEVPVVAEVSDKHPDIAACHQASQPQYDGVLQRIIGKANV